MASKAKSWHQNISNSFFNKIAVVLLRIVVGVTFIFSGLVKAIDPMGSVYKFQEYIGALELSTLAGSEVFLAFAVPILELVLGVMLLTGCLRRSTPILLLLMMAVMLPLTYFLATTNAVPDCGCFGDAIKLTNWQTFWKNVALTLGLLYLLLFNKSVPCVYGPIIQWIVMLLTFLVGFAIAFVGYGTQPLLDFRPYKVGSHIGAQVQSMGEDDFVFIYKKDGVEKEFSIDSIPDEEDGWEFVDRKKTTPDLTPAQKAALNPFSIYDNGTDITDEVLDSTSNQLLILMPDLPHVNRSYAFILSDLAKACEKQGAHMYCITSALNSEVNEWRILATPSYPIYSGDDSEIKMLARGNPAVVYIEHGIVVWKRTLSTLPAKQLLQGDVPLSKLSDDFDPGYKLWSILWPYLLLMIGLLFVNRIYPVINYIVEKVKHFRK